jgi:hypothetical protein
MASKSVRYNRNADRILLFNIEFALEVANVSNDTFEAETFPLLSPLVPFVSHQIGKFPETSEVRRNLVALLEAIEFFQVQRNITVLRLPYEWWSSEVQLPSSRSPQTSEELTCEPSDSRSPQTSEELTCEPSDSRPPSPSRLA